MPFHSGPRLLKGAVTLDRPTDRPPRPLSTSCPNSPYNDRELPSLLSIILAKLINMHRLDNPILIAQPGPLNRHAPNGLPVPPATHDIGVEPAIRMRQLDVSVSQALSAPPAAIRPTATRDPLFALAAEVVVVVETVVVRGAAAGGDARVGAGEVEAVVVVLGGVGAGGGFEGAEAEDAGDEGPEVGDVGDDDGGGGFAGVPVEVDKGAVAGGEVVVAVEGCAEDDEGTEGEDAEEDDLSGGEV